MPITIDPISPAAPAVNNGTKVQFTSAVHGDPDTTIVWSASSGVIDASTGLWTAPSSGTSGTITATSHADPSVFTTTTFSVKLVIQKVYQPATVLKLVDITVTQTNYVLCQYDLLNPVPAVGGDGKSHITPDEFLFVATSATPVYFSFDAVHDHGVVTKGTATEAISWQVQAQQVWFRVASGTGTITVMASKAVPVIP